MPTIHVRGDIQVETRSVPVECLKLDPNNVRFKHMDRVLSDTEIEDLIWNEPDTRDLLRSVQVSGGLVERPVIEKDYTVREGNRRAVVLRRLRSLAQDGKIEEWPKDQFDMVECEVLPTGVNPVDIDIYLALVHVKGKKPWARLNQARHIYDLYENLNQSYDAIRDHLGMGKRTVQTLNWAYAATTQYLKRYQGKPDYRADINDFVFFDQLYKRRELRDWVSSSEDNLSSFGEWVATGKIKDPSREMSALPGILKNDEALRTLKQGGMDKAKEVLQRRNPALGNKTFGLVEKTYLALQAMPRSEYKNLGKDESKLSLLRKLRDELDDLMTGATD